ncbi:MAG: WSC domain-containing protein [Novosphingobium sp.]|nr:WSC domain-containing protein [Novosphingobium sp.]
MKLVLAIVASVMIVAGMASVSLASGQEYSADACAKNYQKIRIARQTVADAWTKIKAFQRRLDAIYGRLDSIQAERRKLNCINASHSQNCRTLTRERMGLLAELEENRKKRRVADRNIERYRSEYSWLENTQHRCAQASKTRHGGLEELGCFAENRQSDPTGLRGRVLSDAMIKDDPAMTPQKCVSFCSGKNALYAGVQYSKWCFCGSGNYNAVGPSSACTMKCSGDSAQNCGGAWANRVFSTRGERF